MTLLEEIKLKEEIKALRTSRLIDFIKGIAMLVGSVVLFIAIQMPESLLNKKMSDESINRDRAKLIFDLIHNNKDDQDILLELSVIEKAYPDADNVWLSDIKDIYQTRVSKNNLKQQTAKTSQTNTDTYSGANTHKNTNTPTTSQQTISTETTDTEKIAENGSSTELPKTTKAKRLRASIASMTLRTELKELYEKKEKLQIERFAENTKQNASTDLQRKITDVNALIKKKESLLDNLK